MRHLRCFSALVRMAFFSFLMQARQQGVVPVRRHIPRYHFTSGQYARQHSNVSRRGCKVDVMLPAPAPHVLKVSISSHSCLQTQTPEWHIYVEYELPHYDLPLDDLGEGDRRPH